MKKLLFLYFLFCCALASANKPEQKANDSRCQYSFEDICLKVNFISEISRKKSADFRVRVTKGEKNLELEETPKMKLWMKMKNGHEHGSEPLKITKKTKGIFLVSNVWLLMQGQWEIQGSFVYKGENKKFEVPVCVGRLPKDSYLGACK
ncbi:MAG: hypothetical protein CME65_13655 [Halobacteriovoraceae bacterium]|nr:hypothetical protein [Halobacteriovoraceae bacterium]|tara:strand:+ start:3162 stop:3608 length:447 start_codon:yes stop_codon:yes gene_type:complete